MKRIVTGWDERGNAAILFDGDPPQNPDFGMTRASEIWISDATPPDTRRQDDPTIGEWQLEPPPRGSAFRFATYQPGAEVEVHATETLDYVVVLTGELTLLIADKEITLAAGDTVVQQETPHGWANRGDEPCTIAVVLLSAKV